MYGDYLSAFINSKLIFTLSTMKHLVMTENQRQMKCEPCFSHCWSLPKLKQMILLSLRAKVNRCGIEVGNFSFTASFLSPVNPVYWSLLGHGDTSVYLLSVRGIALATQAPGKGRSFQDAQWGRGFSNADGRQYRAGELKWWMHPGWGPQKEPSPIRGAVHHFHSGSQSGSFWATGPRLHNLQA